MSAHPQTLLTPEQYLELERAAEFRSEYYRGKMYAMAGGTYRHGHIIGNLTGLLFQALRGTSCIVTSSDTRLAVSADGLYTYPDVMVVCGERKFVDNRKDTVQNPVLIIEVLSASTEGYDRGFKATQYRALDSLREYVFVSQREAHIEVQRRQADGNFTIFESTGLDAKCLLESIGCAFALRDIYDRIDFDEPE